jgi:hypothetical protein
LSIMKYFLPVKTDDVRSVAFLANSPHWLAATTNTQFGQV